MKLKPALSITEQIELLRERGMTIKDLGQATSFLQTNHYYRLNIYFHKLMDGKNHFRSDIHFGDIVDVYENDKWLRNRILTVLEPIEINIRTQISHYLALTYGADAFYQERIFKDNNKYHEIKNILIKQITRNKKDPIIIHHQKKYQGLFPIWVIVEFFSFNTLSKFYKNLLEKDKKVIAKGIFNSNDYLLGQWLHVLSIQRNICAHYGYLFRREYSIRPIIAKSFNWDQTKNNKLFAQLLIMKKLSNRILWQRFIKTISDYQKNKPMLNLKDYGFPADWGFYLC